MGYSPSIFKAYDIRGVYPTDLDEDLAYKLGRAFVTYLDVREVAVAWDARISGPALRAALIRGITDQGADVVELGICGTDSFYFAVCHFNYAAGMMVTASHNPAQYNGFKMVRANAEPLSGDRGIPELRELVEKNQFATPKKAGKVRKQSGLIEAFAQAVRAEVDLAQIKPLKVVMDAGNGVGGLIAPHVFAGLPLQVTQLCFEPDGTFPNHQANPLLPENRRDLEAAVREQGADLGIAWDADTDRCFFVDEHAALIPGDFVTARLAAETLRHTGPGPVVYDARASRCVADAVGALGGTPLMGRIGHAFIKAQMREVDGVFGGEVTGHYYYRFANSYLDNGWIPALQMLALRSREGRPMSAIFADLSSRYHITGEINFMVRDADGLLKKLEAQYANAAKRIYHLDGLSVEMDGYWFNVRKSNTEPLVRLNLEADSPQILQERRLELEALITSG